MTAGDVERGAYSVVATTVVKHLRSPARILDAGCGPCDKTAILQELGYQCAGYDDLQDDWHNVPGNREKILAFAKECGIDFRLAQGGELPFQKGTFDMIMLHDVLEHFHDSPRDFVNSLLELGSKDALLFATVPNAVNIRKRIDVVRGRTNFPTYESYYWQPGHFRGHVREYVRDDLVRFARYLDLEVLELSGCDHMLQKVPSGLRPLYLIVTKFFPKWKDSWLLVAKKRAGWMPRTSPPNDAFTRDVV